MRALITGGRSFADKDLVFRTLDRLHGETPFTLLIEGGAQGADAFGKAWAEARQVPHVQEPADWDDLTAPGALIKVNKFGKPYNAMAGLHRNTLMLTKHDPDVCISFSGGSGTADMTRKARVAGVKVITA